MLGTFDRKTKKPERVGGLNIGNFLGKGAIALVILAGTMSLTNPSREEYLNYATTQLAIEVKDNLCKESKIPDILSGISQSLVDACNSIIKNQRGSIKQYIENSTQRSNKVLFSIYTTDVWDRRYQTIGAFGNFFTFSSESLDDVSDTSVFSE